MTPGRRADLIEGAAAALSALVVLAMIGFLLYEAVFSASSLPDLRVSVEPARVEEGRAHLRFAVANAGGRTAAAVVLSLVLRDGGTMVERRSVTLDYVPAHSRVTGGLYLPEGAGGLAVELVLEGYADP